MASEGRWWTGLGLVTGSTISSGIGTLVVGLIAVGFLDKPNYGHFVFFLATTTLVGSLCDLGISVRMVSEYDSGTRTWRTPLSSFWSAQLCSYGLGLVVLGAFALIRPVTDLVHIPRAIALLGALNGVLVGLFNFETGVLQAKQEWAERGRVILVQTTARTGAAIVGLWLGSATSGAVGATCGAAAGLAVATVTPGVRTSIVAASLRFSVAEAWRTWLESRWFTAACVLAAVAAYVPVAAVGRDGPAQLAVFGLAWQLAAGPGLILSSVMTYLFPSGTDPRVPASRYLDEVRMITVRALILFVIVGAAAPFVIPIVFGSGFEGSVVPFEFLLGATAVYVVVNPVQFLHYRLTGSRTVAAMDTVLVATWFVTFLLLQGSISSPVAVGAATLVGAIASRAFGSVLLLRRREQLTPLTHTVEQ